MPAALFVCLPLEGHLRPVAAVAAALQSLGGVDVEFAALEPNRATVEALGVPFVSLGDLDEEQRKLCDGSFKTGGPEPTLYARALRAAGSFTSIEEVMFPRLQALLGRSLGHYSLLVTDQATLAAHDAAAVAGLPVAVLHQLPLSYALAMAGSNSANLAHAHVPVELPGCVKAESSSWLHSLLLNPVLKRWAARQYAAAYAVQRAAVRARLGLPTLPRSSAPFELPAGVPRAVNIVSGTMELEVERPLPPGWHVSGPQGLLHNAAAPAVLDVVKDAAVASFLRGATDAGERVVYVALGSLVTPHRELVQAMAAAFESVPPGVRFLWSLKQDSHAFLPPALAPPTPGVAPAAGPTASSASSGSGRVMVVPWAPQAALLAHPTVSLFVTHAGLGSLYEGLAAGKPLLALPFFADQHINAQHLADRKLGLWVDASASAVASLAQRLSTAISALLADAAIAQRAAELGSRLRSSSGAVTAARLIADFAAEGQAGAAAVPAGSLAATR